MKVRARVSQRLLRGGLVGVCATQSFRSPVKAVTDLLINHSHLANILADRKPGCSASRVTLKVGR